MEGFVVFEKVLGGREKGFGEKGEKPFFQGVDMIK